MYDMELLFTSRSINQVLLRSAYLKRFSEQRKKDVHKIFEKRDDAEEQRLLLQRQLAEQRELIASKRSEEHKLMERAERRKKLLTELRKDKKQLRQEVERAKNAAKELEQLISQLIEEERQRARDAASANESPATSDVLPAVPELSFEQKRGQMRWPVSQGKIVGRFGNQQHPVLKTVTQNTGIDIAVAAGTNVVAVARGRVSKISWLPSFGNLLILDHSRGYRTVYAHLSEISVTEGQILEEGTVLGKSGESLGGQVLHFEIWKDRLKQDPEVWLAPKGITRR